MSSRNFRRKTRARKVPMMKVEKKDFDVASATYACDTTGSVTALNLIDEGTGDSARIGRKIQLVSVQVRGLVRPQDTLIDGANCVANVFARVMLVWDKQVNGALASITDILSASNSKSFMNLDNRERFTVVMDKKFVIGPNVRIDASGLVQSGVGHVIDEWRKFSGTTIFDGTGSGISDINTGAMLLVTIGDQVSGVGAEASVITRVRYTDA